MTLRRRLGFTALAFVLFVGAVEGALQLAALLIGPQTHIPEGSSLAPPDPDAFRVLAVGDSWVYGAESEPEEAFIEVFARRYGAETGRRVQVYNFGQSASNSSQALVRVYENIETVQPHLVVALTGANNMLHDSGVVDAGRIMGEDIRLSGIPGLRWSRIYRAIRQVLVVRKASQASDEPVTPTPAQDLLYGTGGADPTGRTGLPPAPASPDARVVPWEWWPSYARRDWKVGLQWVQATDPLGEEPEHRGILAAWEALFLARLERFEEADARAREALELGGDDAVAWEALAVSAQLRDRPLEATKYRLRASDAFGQPWIKARARALVLLELEAWEAAEVWLLACQDAQPQNLEVLLGLSRLPAATRAERIEEILAEGPSGRVSQLEYYLWHRVSSGRIDRMVASLGSVDAGEARSMTVARGDAAILTEQLEEAAGFFREVLDDAEARELDRARARAGLVRLARDAQSFEELLGVSPDALAIDPSNAPALVRYHSMLGDCPAAVAAGQAGLALGVSGLDFESSAGSCLSREVGWSLVEQALGRGPVLDRAALVLGERAGGLPGPLSEPDLPWWGAFRERRFAEVAEQASADWRGLALAHLGQSTEALAALEEASAAGLDGAVIAYARSLLRRESGDFTGSFLEAVSAASVENGHPWVRSVARGIALSQSLKWHSCQSPLLAALRVAPGYLEALEALAAVPQPLRYPAVEVALRYVPSGQVPADRWAEWYLAQERFTEARLALSWPEDFLASDPSSRARRAIALGRIQQAEGQASEARASFQEALEIAEDLESQALFCRAAARRALVSGKEVDSEGLVLLTGACPSQAQAIDAAGRIAALRGQCDSVTSYARRALDAGSDPADVSEWMEPCAPAQSVDEWIPGRCEGYPPKAAEWLAHRIHPGDEDEPPEPEPQRRSSDLLVRQLDAVHRLAAAQGADFVALTYPFPGAHHQRLRDKLLAEAPLESLPLLDLYGHFERTYTGDEWQAMRTPEDHVDAGGYAEMGEELFRHLKRDGKLPY